MYCKSPCRCGVCMLMPYPGRDWETCMTMNDNWGYVKDDHDWKSLEDIIGNLVDIVSKGGNYLLNVGPDDLPGQSSLRNGTAGSPAPLKRQASGLASQA